MAQKKLAGPEIAGLLVEERNLCPTQAVRAVSGRIETYQADPLVHQPRILPRAQMVPALHATGEEPIVTAELFPLHPSGDRSARLFSRTSFF